MYSSTYLTVRVHTAEEALVERPHMETVDRLLWLVDVYDIQKDCDPAVHNMLMSSYHEEQECVPGILPRWTKTMLAWVTLLHCRPPRSPTGSELDPVLEWARVHHLLTALPPWTAEDIVESLDALAMRWQTVDKCANLRAYLQWVWDRCREWTMSWHSVGLPCLERVRGAAPVWYALKPVSVMAMLSRYYWFNQTLDQLDWFPHNAVSAPEHFFDQLVRQEKRHLKVQRFRDNLSTLVWEMELYYGDREIAVHDQLGDCLSAYSCLYKRRHIAVMQRFQQTLSYGTYDEILAQFPDALCLHMLRSYFINNYQLDFIKYFVCWERDQHRHRSMLRSAAVPIVLERFGQYTVLHGGQTHGLGSVRDIFPLWLKLAVKPHGCDLETLRALVFTESDADPVGEELDVNTIYT